jgi:cell division septation protein DedD
MAKPSRELQFSTQQLVGVFLGILALGIFIFLLGISIGKKQTLLASARVSPAAKTENVAARTPLTADPGASDIQKEINAHARSIQTTPSKTEPSPVASAAGKPGEKTAEKVPDKAPAKAEPAAQKPSPTDAVGGWFIQVAAVTDKPAAAAFAEKLQKDGYPALLIEPSAKDKKSVYRVRVGPYGSKNEADEAKNKLTEAMKKKKNDYFLVKG